MAKKRRLMKAAAILAMPAAAMVAMPTIAHAQIPAPVPQAPQASINGADLKILTPRANESVRSSTFALDVSFQSRNDSPVTAAELWVDGVRWDRRNLDIPQLKSILSFEVDASTLTGGPHQFIVKVVNQDGAVSQIQAQISVGNGVFSNQPTAGGPELTLRVPNKNKKVSGVIELGVDVNARNGQTPYVTIYIDKQFKTLKNYAPYSYTWDTTTVPNGYHVIEAMGYIEATNATTTTRVKVFVDNPGGATVAKTDVPDLGKASLPAPVTTATANAKPLVIPTPKKVTPKVTKATALKAEVLPVRTAAVAPVNPVLPIPVSITGADFAKPIGAAIPVEPGTTASSTETKSSYKAVSSVAAPRPKVSALPQPKADVPTNIAFASDPTTNTVTVAPGGAAPVIPVQPNRIRPAETAHVKVTVAAPQPLIPLKESKKTSKPTPRAVVRPSGPSVMDMMAVKPVQVAFDGQQVAFDVAPRVEAGMPIAPFRQIFEYTGGQVMWVPETRVVRAVNADREVVISVGKDRARVNGKNVSLDRAAFIERGRTIVPLSFVGKALDVDVKYDAKTGRVSITSKN